MATTLLYRLFGIGKIPEPLKLELQREGVLLLEEGIGGSATYRDFRAPGRYSKWRRQWFSGSLALTEARLVALQYSQMIVNIPLTDERIRRLDVSVERNDTLVIAFDAALFQSHWSGKIEYRFHTPQAGRFQDLLARSISLNM